MWNFQSGDHEPPTDTQIKTALSSVGYLKLTLNDENKTVTKSDSDVKIDLGGAAKGYAADCVREVLRGYDIKYAIIDLGGNICVMGKNPLSPTETGMSEFKTVFLLRRAFSDNPR